MRREKTTLIEDEPFVYKAEELSSFAYFYDAFIILLKNGITVKHRSTNPVNFSNWLSDNRIKVDANLTRDLVMQLGKFDYMLSAPLS